MLRTWGEAQTIRYLDELEGCCRQLADSPASGRSCDHIRPGLYRMEVGKHVIFFRREPTGLLILAFCMSGCSRKDMLSTMKNSASFSIRDSEETTKFRCL